MVNSALQHTDARAVRPYEVGTANFDTPSTTKIAFWRISSTMPL